MLGDDDVSHLVHGMRDMLGERLDGEYGAVQGTSISARYA